LNVSFKCREKDKGSEFDIAVLTDTAAEVGILTEGSKNRTNRVYFTGLVPGIVLFTSEKGRMVVESI